ncbi:MAG: PAS domain-containing sensor histidine kinase [Acidobacteria bacterium]|nr:PAS domain-containing sensor histidine kinase [Acidobacteriota bacterium]
MSADRQAIPGVRIGSSDVLDLLDRHGVQCALVSGEGTVLWASRSLVENRGAEVIGGDCHGRLWRREADCIACGLADVLATGQPHRAWIPDARPGSGGQRRLLLQLKVSESEILEVVIDAGAAADDGYGLFRERVLSEGLRHVPTGVLLLDADLRVIGGNPAACALLGIADRELRGRGIAELFPDGAGVPAQLADLASGEVALDERELTIGVSGERRVVRLCVAAVPGPAGRVAGAVAVLTDMTRQRVLNEALSRKVAELSLLRETGLVLARTVRLDQVLRVILSAVVHPGGIGLDMAALFLVDEDKAMVRGRLARRRPAVEGPLAREVQGQDLEALAFGLPSPGDRAIESLVRRYVVPLERLQHPLVAALGMSRPLQLKPGAPELLIEPRIATLAEGAPLLLAPLFNQGKRLGVLVGSAVPGSSALDEDLLGLAAMVAATAAGAIERSRLHDELAQRLEDLREANSRLRNLQVQVLKAERMSAIGELAAEIVHQIRNPLSVIGGFSRRLSRALGPEDPRADDVRILMEEATRMEAILARIRQEVRLARAPAQEAVDPGEIVDAAVARYRDQALEHRVRLAARVEPGLPNVVGNRDILLEVLDNLLRNAIEAVGYRGKVTVRAQRLKEAVHLVVEDNGPGISPDRLDKIFEPFFTTKVGGTGLGLPLSKRLVAQCGGSLTADSRPGEGARFRIVLRPLQPGSPRDDEA